VDLDSVRKGLSKLFGKLPLNLRNAAFLPPLKKGSLIKMMMTVALIASVTLTVAVLGPINRLVIIGSGGTVNLPVGVGFYWDRNCTDPVSYIDWGATQPGLTVNVTLFVRNEGSQAISLSITAENWQPPEVASYMVFGGDHVGQIIDPQEILQITLSLATSPDIEGITSFSFDINVAVNPV
jgi:hypothetical protein